MQLANGPLKETELMSAVPLARGNIRHIPQEVAPQRQHQHQRMFRHGVGGIAGNVGDRDSVPAAGFDVDQVVSGRRHRDQAQGG